eukprot:CFRG0099T1
MSTKDFDLSKSTDNALPADGMFPNEYSTEDHEEVPHEGIWGLMSRHSDVILKVIKITLLVGWFLYLGFAAAKDIDCATVWLVITGVVVFWKGFFGFLYPKYLEEPAKKVYSSCIEKMAKRKLLSQLIALGFLVTLIIIYVVLDKVWDEPLRFVSLGGLGVYILITWSLSVYPKRVDWQLVSVGMALQFIFGVIILGTTWGSDAFQYIGDRVADFLAFSFDGSIFLFGDGFREHYFAFAVLPTICYFSAFVSLMYYWGVIQWVIAGLGAGMRATMGTSGSESLNAAGNIFVGQTEAPLLIRPFLPDMTVSEIHAVMTGGFATIAGGVMAAYIGMGVDAASLLSASVMSAPAALAFSKLMYPETERSVTAKGTSFKMELKKETNFIEAISNGAAASVPLMANVAAMCIAFISLLACLNSILGSLGGCVGHPQLSFDEICGYIFYPFTILMGVDPKDAMTVASLVGQKTFINEFVAYASLGEIINNRINNTGGDVISERSEVIATYALCGFANIGSMGIQLGGLTPMAPHRASDFARCVTRALLAGTIACFSTACVAGFLMDVPN